MCRIVIRLTQPFLFLFLSFPLFLCFLCFFFSLCLLSLSLFLFSRYGRSRMRRTVMKSKTLYSLSQEGVLCPESSLMGNLLVKKEKTMQKDRQRERERSRRSDEGEQNKKRARKERCRERCIRHF